MPELGITQALLASHLGVSRLTASELLHEKRGLTKEMAARGSKVVGGSPESWLRIQEALDIWQAEKNKGTLTLFRSRGKRKTK
jgi:addiction module HigA family antidote